MLPLRGKDLPLALPLDGFLLAAYPIGGGCSLENSHCIIGIIPRLSLSPFFWRRPGLLTGSASGPKRSVAALASSLDALLLDHAPGLQEPLPYLFDALSVRFQS